MIKEILAVVVLISAFPLGYFLAGLCKDELVQLRRWFRGIYFLTVILTFIFLLFINIPNSFTIIFILIFIAIVCLINLKLSHNKKFLERYENLR